ncbi:hypothetical protein [Lacticigenium naphthae]|nr:hypothetical protein [Lacticigenium naphthae]
MSDIEVADYISKDFDSVPYVETNAVHNDPIKKITITGKLRPLL